MPTCFHDVLNGFSEFYEVLISRLEVLVSCFTLFLTSFTISILFSPYYLQLTEGIGQLLFEMVKGVSKQFHSCTDVVLPLLLVKLGSPRLSSELVFQALSKMVGLMAEHTRKEFAESVWKPLLVRLSRIFAVLYCAFVSKAVNY